MHVECGEGLWNTSCICDASRRESLLSLPSAISINLSNFICLAPGDKIKAFTFPTHANTLHYYRPLKQWKTKSFQAEGGILLSRMSRLAVGVTDINHRSKPAMSGATKNILLILE